VLLCRAAQAAIKSQQVQTNVPHGDTVREYKEHPVATAEQRKDFLSTLVTSNPSVYIQPEQSDREADTPGPGITSSTAYFGRDEKVEGFTAVPKRAPSLEEFD
jgi:hypothetical protein